jgi:Flp pilus assembly protein TadD
MKADRLMLFTAILLFLLMGMSHSTADEPADLAKAMQLRIERKNREAVDAFSKVLDASPNNAGALVQLGAALEDLGKWKEAEAAYRKALDVEPDNSSAKRNLDQLISGRTISAAVKLPRPSHEILMKKGLRALENKDFESAVLAFRLLRGFLPDDPRPLFYSAIVFERSGQAKQAESAYREALKAFPNFVGARVNLVILFLKAGDEKAAAREARAALEAFPSDSRIRYLARMLGAEMKLYDDRETPISSGGREQQ